VHGVAMQIASVFNRNIDHKENIAHASGLQSKRIARRGGRYSILKSAFPEFCRHAARIDHEKRE
jgi:hypothetical protein